MNLILDHLMDKLLKDGFAKSEEAEIVRFGLELASMKILISAATIIVAIALDSAPAVIAFMVVYQPLRSCCGGYHAKTRSFCFLASMFVLFSVITATKILVYKFCHISTLCFIISGLNFLQLLLFSSVANVSFIHLSPFSQRTLLISLIFRLTHEPKKKAPATHQSTSMPTR